MMVNYSFTFNIIKMIFLATSFKNYTRKHCDEILHNKLNIEQLTIAFSRPPNIGDHVTKTKLYQAQGQTASIIMDKY